jgi:hypothetical protein
MFCLYQSGTHPCTYFFFQWKAQSSVDLDDLDSIAKVQCYPAQVHHKNHSSEISLTQLEMENWGDHEHSIIVFSVGNYCFNSLWLIVCYDTRNGFECFECFLVK